MSHEILGDTEDFRIEHLEINKDIYSIAFASLVDSE